MIETEEVKTVLNEAANILEKEGWCQGRGRDSIGRRCMAQAIGTAANRVLKTPYHHEATMKVRLAIGMSLPAWNDNEKRTRDEVISKLREIANSV